MAALLLQNELESVDILDLASAAVHLYNMLVSPRHRIKLLSFPAEHTEEERRRVVEKNWRSLNTYYKKASFNDETREVRDVKTMLIRIHWLAFYQIPENRYSHSSSSLNWQQIRKWLSLMELEDGKGMSQIESSLNRSTSAKSQEKACCQVQ